MKYRNFFLLALLAILTACAPVKRGPTEQSFIAEGQPNIEISVAPPFRLAGSGQKSIRIKNDRMASTSASINYSVFADLAGPNVKRHAHIFLASVPGKQWMLSPETYPARLALSTSKEKIDGKNFTIQVLIIPGEGDWFNELWQINGYNPSDAWLAMRWSTDPNTQERIVAEYREPLPRCLKQHSVYHDLNKGGVTTKFNRQLAWISCEEVLSAFRERGNSVFSFGKPVPGSALSGTNLLMQTVRDRPDLTDLIGETEHLEHGTFRYTNR